MLMLQFGVHYLVPLILFFKPIYIYFSNLHGCHPGANHYLLCLNNYRTSVELDRFLTGLYLDLGFPADSSCCS